MEKDKFTVFILDEHIIYSINAIQSDYDITFSLSNKNRIDKYLCHMTYNIDKYKLKDKQICPFDDKFICNDLKTLVNFAESKYKRKKIKYKNFYTPFNYHLNIKDRFSIVVFEYSNNNYEYLYGDFLEIFNGVLEKIKYNIDNNIQFKIIIDSFLNEEFKGYDYNRNLSLSCIDFDFKPYTKLEFKIDNGIINKVINMWNRDDSYRSLPPELISLDEKYKSIDYLVKTYLSDKIYDNIIFDNIQIVYLYIFKSLFETTNCAWEL